MRWWDVLVCWLRSFWDETDDRLSHYRRSVLAADAERLRTAIRDIEYSISMATLYGIEVSGRLMQEMAEARQLLAAYEAELARCNHAIVA